MEDLMQILSIKNTLLGNRNTFPGITICFKSAEVLNSNYVYILQKDCEKYFQILEVSSDTNSNLLLYKAVDCGYGADKLSNTINLDIRNLINQPILKLTGKEEIKDLRKRSSYT